MNVLVTGGTGFIGRYLCEELHDRGHDVTAMSRDPDPDVVPEGVGLATGDVTDRGSLDGSFEGRDVVVNLVALSPLFEPTGDKSHESVHLDGTRNVVDAAEAHGLARIVQMSALGADPEGPTEYIRAKGAAEAVVRDSDLDRVIFRPSIVFGDGGEFIEFTETLTTPYVTGLPGGGDTRFQPLWVEDLVSMLADGVADEDRVGESYELGGPDVVTLADVARLTQRAKGRSLAVVPVPMPVVKAGMTVAGAVPAVPFGRDQYRALQLDNTVDDNDVEAFGVSPAEMTTLREYLGLA